MLKPNIDNRGRVARAVGGLLFLVAASFVWPHSVWGAAILAAVAFFMFFEAARGWCAARACGIKTPL